jgi:hypothetical protein
MKKLKPILILLFVLFTSLKGIGQSLTYTFIDPCTKDVTYFSIPIQSGGGTTIFFLGQSTKELDEISSLVDLPENLTFREKSLMLSQKLINDLKNT